MGTAAGRSAVAESAVRGPAGAATVGRRLNLAAGIPESLDCAAQPPAVLGSGSRGDEPAARPAMAARDPQAAPLEPAVGPVGMGALPVNASRSGIGAGPRVGGAGAPPGLAPFPRGSSFPPPPSPDASPACAGFSRRNARVRARAIPVSTVSTDRRPASPPGPRGRRWPRITAPMVPPPQSSFTLQRWRAVVALAGRFGADARLRP